MGRTTSHGYDADNERISTSYSDGVTPDVTFGYNADGQRTAMTDGTGHSSYTYDSLHRMTSTTNGAGAVVRYAYDLRNLLTGITYPGGANTVTRGYDAAGRLTSIADWRGNTTRFGYDADGNLTKAAYPNHTTTYLDYNRADEIARISARHDDLEFLSFGYRRDQSGQVTSENDGRFGYDPAKGKRLWAAELFCRNIKTTPASHKGVVYVSVESTGISYQWRAVADLNGDGKITTATTATATAPRRPSLRPGMTSRQPPATNTTRRTGSPASASRAGRRRPTPTTATVCGRARRP